ncbi:hypothetical protein ABZ744_12150 [Micromonospora chersina]|uniref:hypothetical protein n=1 Tax=Micromonospora chersina TaxID=47854 RepID=UPI0033CAA186
MAEIAVSSGVQERIALLSLAWGISEGEAVERLLNEFQKSGQRRLAPNVDKRIPVHAVYEGSRTDGLFDPGSEVLEITSGALAGKRFRSPSGAAAAVVGAANPRVRPNRNGWAFWVCTDTGSILQMIRRER